MMKFLIDNNLSTQLSRFLIDYGYDAIHVKDVSKECASDLEFFSFAFEQGRTIITADTDFSFIL